jgi:sugar phosphate isomerase/epimerase
LVPEARGGPFVFWDDLPLACEVAGQLGFDAIEIFAPGPEALKPAELRALLGPHRLQLAALGTGGGWIRRRLTLTSPNPEVRREAQEFVKSMIDRAGEMGAGVIIGSLQGRWDDKVNKEQALQWLAEGFHELRGYAHEAGVTLLYEFLNRYETNLINRVEEAVAFIRENELGGVKLLADLFHMNIEEKSVPDAIRAGGDLIGHVHFVDSNRRAAGMGHTDFQAVVDALREIGYKGYLSAEAMALPDSETAARQTIETFKKYTTARES